jgi:hypothetical protein
MTLIETMRADSYSLPARDGQWIAIEGEEHPVNSLTIGAEKIEELERKLDFIKREIEGSEDAKDSLMSIADKMGWEI